LEGADVGIGSSRHVSGDKMSDIGSAVDELATALRASHERLAGILSSLSDSQLDGRSYDSDWTVAQVASHLGSGAEIFGRFVECGVARTSAADVEFQPVWDAWNAKSPRAQAGDLLAADRALLDQIRMMDADTRQRWHLEFFGMRHDITSLLRMRLAEHALHTWDIAVGLRPSETVAPDAVELVIDNLAGLVERSGKTQAGVPPVRVVTTNPARAFVLELNDTPARLRPASEQSPTRLPLASKQSPTMASLRLPAEAFVRLVYGRLDPDHTPDGSYTDGTDLDTLRRAFPGI
jgi:uncharacterized protein (TIGR03083 family)